MKLFQAVAVAALVLSSFVDPDVLDEADRRAEEMVKARPS